MKIEKKANYDIAEFLRPARAAGVGSDVLVPLFQAMVSGLLIGGLSLWPVIRFYWAWYIPLIIGGGAFSVAWFLLLQSHRASLWDKERYTNTAAGPAADPEQIRVKLRIEESPDHYKFVDLPLAPDQLRTIAKATVNGRSFSLASWAGRGKLLTRSQFETVRDWLIANDYALWADPSNHNQGVNFTNKGSAFWRGLAE